MKRRTIRYRLISRPVVTSVGTEVWPAMTHVTAAPAVDAMGGQSSQPRCPEALSFAAWRHGEQVITPAVTAMTDTVRDDRETTLV